MKALIVGCGNVGLSVAQLWRNQGHMVWGTTTTESKLDGLAQQLDKVFLCTGSDRKQLAELASQVDVVVVSVAPPLKKSITPAQRQQIYKSVLVDTCENVSYVHERCIFLSSFSVYGDGGEGSDPVDELTPLTENQDASPMNYQLAERHILATPKGVVLRLPDIYGAPGDLDYAERLKFSWQYMAGKVPFSAEAPLYRIHYQDVVRAVDHVIKQDLVGVFNVCENKSVPPSNATVFDRFSKDLGMEPLTFLGHIKAPNRKISSTKFCDTGFQLQYDPLVFT